MHAVVACSSTAKGACGCGSGGRGQMSIFGGRNVLLQYTGDRTSVHSREFGSIRSSGVHVLV